MTVPRRLAASARAARRRLSSTIAGVGHSGHLSSAALRNRHDVPLAEAGLTAAQKYMFDLNGFLVIRGAFDADLVARANGAIDHHADTLHERTGQLRTSGLYGRESAQLAGDGTTGRFDMGGMLGWRAPHREPFRELLTHPAVAGALNELVGVGYRLDHSPLLIAQERGSEGHTLHGGAVTESGEPAWPLAYECRHGQMRNQLLTVCMQLSAAPEGAGGFCAVPGSHKSNFPVPPSLADLADEALASCVVQPALQPGDCLLFSEATLHGTLPWTAAHQRRTVIYRFAPAGSAYGRGYLPSWPESVLDGASEAQRAVLEPPYHPRMNRTSVDRRGEAVAARAREAWKVEFDERVFGTRYF
mmetsp:Transcript_23293/g.70763  ORF Transcript_23293/g.70763 Transcript_23293/m.70763 type:complete len:359 (+) Transcript_23293:29-1105(+)